MKSRLLLLLVRLRACPVHMIFLIPNFRDQKRTALATQYPHADEQENNDFYTTSKISL